MAWSRRCGRCAASLADGLVAAPSGYAGSVTSTKLKVSGIDVFSAGDFSGGEGAEDIVLRDAARGVYKRVVVRDDRVVGAVLYGDTADGNWYFDLLKRGEDVGPIRDALIFGQAFAQGGGHRQTLMRPLRHSRTTPRSAAATAFRRAGSSAASPAAR